MGENPKCFVLDTRKMLESLEKLLHAPKGSISFVPSSDPLPNAVYRKPAIDVGGDIFDFVLTGAVPSSRLLLCRTVDVLVECYQNFSYASGEGRRFYNYAKKKDNSPEGLAKIIYQELFRWLSEFYGGALGIDFDIMTALAEAVYEKDAAVGRLLFYTGKVSCKQLNKWCSPVFKKRVALCTENIRHMRKLLAGTGNDKDGAAGNSGLLFVRAADGDGYDCCGYISQKFYEETLVSVFINGKGGWEFSIGNQVSFCAKDNRAFLPPSFLEGVQEKIEEELGEGFGHLFPVLEALSAQRHGTSVVFLDLDNSFAGKWMETLASRGRAAAVDPIPLQAVESNEELKAMLKNISRIDGALVVDYPSGELRYTNVIVDGKAVISGRPDAGARHNALRAFVANLVKEEHGQCLTAFACIFSEDGGISVETASGCRKDMEEKEEEEAHLLVPPA